MLPSSLLTWADAACPLAAAACPAAVVVAAWVHLLWHTGDAGGMVLQIVCKMQTQRHFASGWSPHGGHNAVCSAARAPARGVVHSSVYVDTMIANALLLLRTPGTDAGRPYGAGGIMPTPPPGGPGGPPLAIGIGGMPGRCGGMPCSGGGAPPGPVCAHACMCAAG